MYAIFRTARITRFPRKSRVFVGDLTVITYTGLKYHIHKYLHLGKILGEYSRRLIMKHLNVNCIEIINDL